MSSRKRFKADINETSMKALFARKYQKCKQIDIIEREPVVKSVQAIPSELLPGAKETRQRDRAAYMKPENWIDDSKKPKLTKKEVLERERININKTLDECQSWSRAARSLSCAIKPVQKAVSLCIEDVEDRDGRTKIGNTQVRKNMSREFLETFFKEAESISKQRRPKKRPRTPTKIIPKLAAGLKPGTDQIIL